MARDQDEALGAKVKSKAKGRFAEDKKKKSEDKEAKAESERSDIDRHVGARMRERR